MVFYHNSIAQIMGSMGLVGIAAYGVLMGIVSPRCGPEKHPFVRALALSYLGMLLISLTNPWRVLPLPQCSADGDGLYSGGGGHRRAVPVGEMLGLRPTRRIYLPQK